jgi:hypothetical protein
MSNLKLPVWGFSSQANPLLHIIRFIQELLSVTFSVTPWRRVVRCQ